MISKVYKVLAWYLVLMMIILPYSANATPSNINLLKSTVESSISEVLQDVTIDKTEAISCAVNPVKTELDAGANWLVKESLIKILANNKINITSNDSIPSPRLILDVLELSIQGEELNSGFLSIGADKLIRKTSFNGVLKLFDSSQNLVWSKDLSKTATDTIIVNELEDLNSTLAFAKIIPPDKKNTLLDTVLLVVVGASLVILFLQTKTTSN
jgi:hypothetical protein